MKPTVNCITLPVESVQDSFAFYSETLGLSGEAPGANSDHVAFTLAEKMYLVIITRKEFLQFTSIANQSEAPKGFSECVLSYFAESSEEVDSILQKAKSANALLVSEASERDWGYAGYFKDPDGHLWEIMWNRNL